MRKQNSIKTDGYKKMADMKRDHHDFVYGNNQKTENFLILGYCQA